MATKKDYETIARVIGHVQYAIDNGQVRAIDGMSFGFPDVASQAQATTMLDVLAGWLSFNFETDNPRYDPDRFKAAIAKAREDGPFV